MALQMGAPRVRAMRNSYKWETIRSRARWSTIWLARTRTHPIPLSMIERDHNLLFKTCLLWRLINLQPTHCRTSWMPRDSQMTLRCCTLRAISNESRLTKRPRDPEGKMRSPRASNCTITIQELIKESTALNAKISPTSHRNLMAEITAMETPLPFERRVLTWSKRTRGRAYSRWVSATRLSAPNQIETRSEALAKDLEVVWH